MANIIFSSHYSSIQYHMILQNHSNVLIWHSRKFQILSVFKSDVPPKKFYGNCATFFQDSLTNRNNKKIIYLKRKSFVTLYMSLQPHLINLMYGKFIYKKDPKINFICVNNAIYVN